MVTRLEKGYGQKTDPLKAQKPGTLTTLVAAVTVSFPIFAPDVPPRIGSTPVGWFFGVGRAGVQKDRRCS
jgi:hypothetical protein